MKLLKYFITSITCIFLLNFASCTPKGPVKSPFPKPEKETTPVKVEEVGSKLIWRGAVKFSNSLKYQEFLRGNRRCDPCEGFYTGPLKCKNFGGKATLSLEFDKQELPSQATLTMQPYYTGKQPWGNLYLGVCNAHPAPLSPIKISGDARYANQYEGFYINFTEGDIGGRGYIFVQSSSTNPATNGTLKVNLYYGGSATSSAKFGKADLVNPNLEDLDGSAGGYSESR